MSEDYTIEQLEKTFKEHAQRNIIQNQRALENYKINYPDSEVPSHFLNEFCISEALHVICREINSIKRTINLMLEDDDSEFLDLDIAECIKNMAGISKNLLGHNTID